jgi:hypothetical protein
MCNTGAMSGAFFVPIILPVISLQMQRYWTSGQAEIHYAIGGAEKSQWT